MGLLRMYHATLWSMAWAMGLTSGLEDYRLSMLEILVFWIVTGGYCDYEGERATALHNSLARCVADLASMELLEGPCEIAIAGKASGDEYDLGSCTQQDLGTSRGIRTHASGFGGQPVLSQVSN